MSRQSLLWVVSCLATALACGSALAADVVRIDSGGLSGVAADDVVSFKGIPFAAPPVGDLRWRPPAPPAPWPGVRAATAYGAVCMQKISADNGLGPGPASEDCLTLNVFTPVGKTGPALPVMVWIHGGGLVNGSGTAALYDGSALARQGVVVVTINYRLGRFGFFAHPALTAEQRGAALANYGLMDQIAALKWVRRNIARFGGDPGNVTIFGESAGGLSVNRLMMMRQARGLFHKAIVESGAGRERGETLARAEQAGAAFAAKLGVTAPDPAKLRAIPADAIVAAGDLDLIKGEAPILDGVLLTENPSAAFAAGRVARVPYLIGSNSLEFPNSLRQPVSRPSDQAHAGRAGQGGRGLWFGRVLQGSHRVRRDFRRAGSHPCARATRPWRTRLALPVLRGVGKGAQGRAGRGGSRLGPAICV